MATAVTAERSPRSERGEYTGTDPDLAALLSEQEMPVSEVLQAITEITLAKAWARGDIEFGRLAHCVTGRPGIPESLPTLFVESGIEWTGPKTSGHKKFSGLLADSKKVPDCLKYRKYVSYEEAGETKWRTMEITRVEAEKLLALSVRLTDKGLGESDI